MKTITENTKNYRISVDTDGTVYLYYYGAINFGSYDLSSWHEWGIIDANDNLWDAIEENERTMRERLYRDMNDVKAAIKNNCPDMANELLQDISGLSALCTSFRYDLAWAMQEAWPEYVQGQNEQLSDGERMCRVLKRWEQDNPEAWRVLAVIALS